MRHLPLILCLLGASTAAAQGGSALARELDRIADRYDARVAYASQLVDVSGAVAPYRAVSLEADLAAVLTPHGLRYVRVGRQYVVAAAAPSDPLTVAGFVEDGTSAERLVGATVYAVDARRGVSTNAYGYFSLQEVDPDERLVIRYLGYAPDTVLAGALASGSRTVRLRRDLELLTVEVLGALGAGLPVEGEALSPRVLDRTQALNGRRDVNSWLSVQPGVQSAASGYRGYGFRGADPEHNLTLLDDANLYLPSHAAGFFSIIQGESLRSWRVHRDAGPARYGDHAGGVLDLRLREGNRNARASSVNVGLSDVSAATEGPVGRGSYFVSGRRALSDFWLEALRPSARQRREALPEISFGFYDLAAKVNQELDERQSVYVSLFLGRDRYRDAATVFASGPADNTRYTERSRRVWQNALASARHSIALGDRWFVNSTFTLSDFRYNATDDAELAVTPADRGAGGAPDSAEVFTDTTVYDSRIRDLGLRTDLQYALSSASIVTFGIDATAHRFELSSVSRTDDAAPGPPVLQPVVTLDLSSYLSLDYRPTDRLRANVGVRVSSQLGGDETFVAPLPRASLAYRLAPRYTLSASFAQARQYVHQISTNNPGLPRDLWVPTFRGLRPLSSDQASLGATARLRGTTLTATAYVTRLRGVTRLSNDFLGANYEDWVENLRTGWGESHGLELQALREWDRLTLEASYTYARATRRYRDPLGAWQPVERARLDRRHAGNLVLEYRPRPSWSVTGALRLGSGLPARRPRSNDTIGVLTTDLPLTNAWDYDPPARQLQLRPFVSVDGGLRWRPGGPGSRQEITAGAQNLTLRRNPLFFNIRRVPDPEPGQGLDEFTEVFAPPILPYLRYARSF